MNSHPFLSQYDRVVCISLPERKDRRRNMLRQRFPFEFFNGIRPDGPGAFATIGFRGSYLSHLEVLSHGGSVLIIEDDCNFTSEARGYRVPDCDIFYGGFDEIEGGGIIGAHCMGFSAKAAEYAAAYLAALIDKRVGPDPRAVAEGDYDGSTLPPIDGAYVWFRRAHPELKTVFHKISRQWPPSRSDCTPGQFDHLPFVSAIRSTKAGIMGTIDWIAASRRRQMLEYEMRNSAMADIASGGSAAAEKRLCNLG